jgi:hypothetical protein
MDEFAWVGRILVGVGMLVILGERFRAIGLAGLLIHLFCACWVGYASQRFGPAWPLETLYPVGALAGSTLSGLTGAVIWAVIWWPADALTLPVRKARRLGVYLLPTLVVAGLWTVLLGVANNYANSASDWPVLQSDSVTPLLHWFVFGLAVFCAKILATRGAGLAWRLPVVLAMTLAPTLYFARFGRSLPSDGWDLWLMVAVLALAAPASAQAVRSVEVRDKVLGGRRAAILASACLVVFGGLILVGWAETSAAGRESNENYSDSIPHDWVDFGPTRSPDALGGTVAAIGGGKRTTRLDDRIGWSRLAARDAHDRSGLVAEFEKADGPGLQRVASNRRGVVADQLDDPGHGASVQRVGRESSLRNIP